MRANNLSCIWNHFCLLQRHINGDFSDWNAIPSWRSNPWRTFMTLVSRCAYETVDARISLLIRKPVFCLLRHQIECIYGSRHGKQGMLSVGQIFFEITTVSVLLIFMNLMSGRSLSRSQCHIVFFSSINYQIGAFLAAILLKKSTQCVRSPRFDKKNNCILQTHVVSICYERHENVQIWSDFSLISHINGGTGVSKE